MPLHEYACRDCSHKFEALVSQDRPPSCPSCGRQNLERLLSVFAVSTKSAPSASNVPATGCGTCGDPRGPGSCSSSWDD